MAEAKQPQPTRLADYRAPDFLVDQVDLTFELDPDLTTVTAVSEFRRNPHGAAGCPPLRLDGSGPELLELALDGETLGGNRFRIDQDRLIIDDVPDRFTLRTRVTIRPNANTTLDGLYQSGGNLVTQCEAEGFRKITYWPDRPDVPARFRTTLIADRAAFPILLSNGNRVDQGTHDDGRHFVSWDDPFPKPSYLFALVAGDLVAVRDRFVTAGGRDVALAIWVRAGDEDKCSHAMASLKTSMAWDEQIYGLEYDLDSFNIVAVSDFNMGAMENKSLNIFNTALVLASPQSATDDDFRRIESVIAHEYFHNWTGNRITCRDWFQLTLKEGLTVFRDQQFSADQMGHGIARIRDVRRLRASQFPEDAGPMAHPIRPDTYIEINNFYTATVYEKGAEIIRMIHTIIGREAFRRGMDRYVATHDHQAVTCEDFVACMEAASGADLSAFGLWYRQAGTPRLAIREEWDEGTGTLTLDCCQTTPPTPGQPEKSPLVIPLKIGLLGENGQDLPARRDGDPTGTVTASHLLMLDQAGQRFSFTGLAQRPIPSLLRDFSAPVKLTGQSRSRLGFLFAKDSNPFARWEAGQQYATLVLLEAVAGPDTPIDPEFLDAFGRTLADARLTAAERAEALSLPGEDYLADQMGTVDPVGIHHARERCKQAIAAAHHGPLMSEYLRLDRQCGGSSLSAEAMGGRALKNLALALLTASGADAQARDYAWAQCRNGATMTDVLGGLRCLVRRADGRRDEALAAFHDRWRGDDLVIDKWFSLQATAPTADTPKRVAALRGHPDFTRSVPNRLRSLIGAFAYSNPLHFHAEDGSGYALLREEVLQVDPINPAMAARLVIPLGRWRRQTPRRQAHMKAALEQILGRQGLSKDVFEIASKSLA